jgi:hypothetical protein
MTNDPHYYAWLGLVISWIVLPVVALQAFLRYRKTKKRFDIVIVTACLALFIFKIIRGHI